jgi:hypothetical protein
MSGDTVISVVADNRTEVIFLIQLTPENGVAALLPQIQNRRPPLCDSHLGRDHIRHFQCPYLPEGFLIPGHQNFCPGRLPWFAVTIDATDFDLFPHVPVDMAVPHNFAPRMAIRAGQAFLEVNVRNEVA